MSDLKSLKIDRNRKQEGSSWATRWILTGVLLFVLLGVARFAYSTLNAATEVETVRVASQSANSVASQSETILNATGYIVAHHKIEVAAKVIGRVAWIGVEKGDHVKQGQVIVRLEDNEYRAQLAQAEGSLANLQAKLAELVNGSRPEEIEVSTANLKQATSDMENAKISLDRTLGLAKDGVMSKQALDDAQARYDGTVHHVRSLEKTDSLMRLGVRKEQIAAMRGSVQQAKGAVDYAQTQLDDTVIKSPVDGTILERAVEKGEFVTTSFVGDKGAKGYVVSLADLNDLQAELDISQNDFAKLHMGQKATITTDAFKDRKYTGDIAEFSPEANRQKATVQVKVKVNNPDGFMRPEMNTSVAFLNDAKPVQANTEAPRIVVPPSAVKADTVFIVLGGKAIARPVKTGATTSAGVQINDGLIGGEDLIESPPAGLKNGARVHVKGA